MPFVASLQKLIDGAGANAPLPNRPDDERLAAAHVAGGKHLSQRGLVIGGVGPHVAALVEIDAKRLEQALMHRMDKAHRQQHELGFQLELGAGQRLEALVDLHAMQFADLAVLAGKILRQHRIFAPGALGLAR